MWKTLPLSLRGSCIAYAMLETMDTSNLSADQLTSLLGKSSDKVSLFNMDKIMASLQPFIIALTVLSIVLTILYIFHLIQKVRVNKAILEIRDTVREINQRQKIAETGSPKPPTTPSDTATY